MPNRPTRGSGGCIYHVMNRATRGQGLFHDDDAYLLFLRTLREARELIPMRLLAYCLMPNHWHLLLWPAADGELPLFMKWLSMTHARRLHRACGSEGKGAVYQGRFKSVLVYGESAFYRVARYVERNPVRAGFVNGAASWRWSSASGDRAYRLAIARWPVAKPTDWIRFIDGGEPAEELDELRQRLKRRLAIGPTPPALAIPADAADDPDPKF